MKRTPAIVPASIAVFCVNCRQISNSTGERCIACDSVGGLLNLARILDGKFDGTSRDIPPIEKLMAAGCEGLLPVRVG